MKKKKCINLTKRLVSCWITSWQSWPFPSHMHANTWWY